MASLPGSSTLSVTLRPRAAHVNELYPTRLELSATQATVPGHVGKSEASQITQQVAEFRVPVQVQGAPATISATLFFAVCTDANCVPQSQGFRLTMQ